MNAFTEAPELTGAIEWRTGEDGIERPFVMQVDGNTGEVTAVALVDMGADKQMYAIGDSIANAHKEIAQIEQATKSREMELRERTKFAIGRIEARIEWGLSMAESAMGLMGNGIPRDKKKRPYYVVPSVGKFKYQKKPDKLDTSLWSELTEKEKANLATAYPDMVKTKMTYTPIAATVKKALQSKDGGVKVIGGVQLIVGGDELSFKGD